MDIVILGGGVIGLAMANLLVKQTSHTVTIISPTQAADVRYSAITTATKNILQYLEVWDEIIATPAGTYDTMYLWDQDSHADITIKASDLGVPELGHIINNQTITESLYNKLHDVRFIAGAANRLDQFLEYTRVYVNDITIDAHLVIAADGAKSWVRNFLQIPTYGWDYHHHAIVATVEMLEPHANTAKQRFTADGTLAFLPLAEAKLCSTVCSTLPSNAERLMQLSPAEFANEIGVAKLCSLRVSFPLRMLHAKHYTQPRVVLIGDAAHVIHPLAGQGMNLGFLDAATLAECLVDAQDVGDYKILRRYERMRKSNNWGMIALMEGCKHLFANQHPAIQLLRKFGMQSIDKMVPSKNFLAKVGMGVLGELPNSARSYL